MKAGIITSRNLVSPKHPSAPDDEEHARGAGDPGTERRHFLNEHESGDGSYPPKVHYPGDEKQEHEQPAASGAVSAVAESHQERATAALAPFGQKESERRAAMPEARVLERGPLKDTS